MGLSPLFSDITWPFGKPFWNVLILPNLTCLGLWLSMHAYTIMVCHTLQRNIKCNQNILTNLEILKVLPTYWIWHTIIFSSAIHVLRYVNMIMSWFAVIWIYMDIFGVIETLYIFQSLTLYHLCEIKH